MSTCPNCNNDTSKFVDDPILPDITQIRSLHINQMVNRILWVCSNLGLPVPSLSTVSNEETIKAVHIQQIRTAIENIYNSIGVDLSCYFKYDYEGNPVAVNGWSSGLITGQFARYIHVEDGRRPMLADFIVNFSGFSSHNLTYSGVPSKIVTEVIAGGIDSIKNYLVVMGTIDPSHGTDIRSGSCTTSVIVNLSENLHIRCSATAKATYWFDGVYHDGGIASSASASVSILPGIRAVITKNTTVTFALSNTRASMFNNIYNTGTHSLSAYAGFLIPTIYFASANGQNMEANAYSFDPAPGSPNTFPSYQNGPYDYYIGPIEFKAVKLLGS